MRRPYINLMKQLSEKRYIRMTPEFSPHPHDVQSHNILLQRVIEL